ncbi:nuclear transport factor 2 family protein [Streptomyces sp. NPDC049881]|uniref:nuclear transport factor 2 family protein n=1 Tax=unclassified Streptomyces TaxID=2593676 RepID=UPI003441E479
MSPSRHTPAQDRLADLADLADRLELAELTARLGHWLDDKAFDDTASLFTPGVVGEFPGGAVEGAAALAAHARGSHAADVTTHHATAGVAVTLDGDEATVRATQTVTFNKPGPSGEPDFTVGERYDLRALRTPGGWRFTRIHVHPVWRS